MPTNPWLYDLATEWRRWQGQYGKLLLLLVGFALVCALLTLVLRLGSVLDAERPVWFTAEGHYYTLANQSEQGQLQGISRQTLQVASQSAGISSMSWLVPKNMTLSFENQQLVDLQLIFFAPNWFTFSGMVQTHDTQGIWLSDRFWRQHWHADPSIIGKFLHHKRIPQGLKILGVLPPTADRIGPWQADIWLSGDYLRYLTVFDVESTLQVDRFLAAVPQYYGILRSDQPLQAANLTERLQKSDLQVAGMIWQDSGYQIAIHQGINLDPTAHQHLQSQWELLLFLVLGMGLVLTLNLFTLYANRLVLWQEELRLFQVLGASRWQQLRPVLLAAVVWLSIIAALAWWLGHGLAKVVAADPAYQTLSGSQTLSMQASQFSASLCLILMLFLLAGVVPLLGFYRQALFRRAMNSGRSRLQKLTAQANLTLQLLMALLALNMACTQGFALWQQYQHNPTPAQVSMLSVQHQGSALDLSTLQAGLVNGLTPDSVAWSSSSFTTPTSLLLEDSALPKGLNVGQMWVSASYFAVMGQPIAAIDSHWQSGVVINQSMANILARQWVGKSVLGSQLSLGLMAKPQPIIAIIPDLPHYGRSAAPQPMTYLPLPLVNNKVFFYITQGQETVLMPWLKQQMHNPVFDAAIPLRDLIAQQDNARWQLLWSAIMVVILIVMAVLISLSYQLKARLRLERHEYGVLLAIGAPMHFLQWRMLQQALLALIVALPFVVTVQNLLVYWGRNTNSQLVLFDTTAFVSASLLLTLLVIMCCLWPLHRLLQQPIYQILRQHD